ncbi:MAG: hypothetical protein GY851_26525 [bacterium]|nr:hypothetical protein [bacterium]
MQEQPSDEAQDTFDWLPENHSICGVTFTREEARELWSALHGQPFQKYSQIVGAMQAETTATLGKMDASTDVLLRASGAYIAVAGVQGIAQAVDSWFQRIDAE